MSALNHDWFPHKWEYVNTTHISDEIYCTVCGYETVNSFIAFDEMRKLNPMCLPLVEIIENV